MPERRILLVRHGVAEDFSPTGRDADRALTPEGWEKMRAAARGMAALDVAPSHLISSPLLRARETADALSEVFPSASRDVWDELACGVDEYALTARLEDLPAGGEVMLVGHEPDMGRLLSYWLSGRCEGFSTRFRKGATACVRGGALPPDGRATLEWVLTPKQAGRIVG